LLQVEGISGHERLIRYWQRWLDAHCEACTDQKCLVVKLSGEVADLSDAMRMTLRDGTDQVVARITRLIEAGSPMLRCRRWRRNRPHKCSTSCGSVPACSANCTAIANALDNAMKFTQQVLAR
jgi:hypothetical protein